MNFKINGRDRQNIIAVIQSLISKPVGLVSGFLTASILLKYLGEYKYGIWISLFSSVGWLSIIDFGLGHGMRNRLSELSLFDDSKKKQLIISETYSQLLFVISFFILLFSALVFFIDFRSLFNAHKLSESELRKYLIVLLISVLTGFYLKLINSIFHSIQKTGWASLLESFCNFLFLFCLCVFIFLVGHVDLNTTSILFGTTVVLVYLVVTIIFFKYNKFGFKFPVFSFSYLSKQNGISLSKEFFIIQISFILIYQTDNFIILHLFGPEMVAKYYLIFKYITILFILFQLILSPYWSSITNAKSSMDIEWIEKSFKRLFNIIIILIIIQAILLVFGSLFFNLWLSKIVFDYKLALLMSIQTILMMLATLVATFLNGLGVLTFQRKLSIVLAFINFPLVYVLCIFLELEGAVLSSILINLTSYILLKKKLEITLNNLK